MLSGNTAKYMEYCAEKAPYWDEVRSGVHAHAR